MMDLTWHYTRSVTKKNLLAYTDLRCEFSLSMLQRRALTMEVKGIKSRELHPMAAAAASACPVFPLIDVQRILANDDRSHRTAVAAPTSTGSPSAVPVPWASRAGFGSVGCTSTLFNNIR